MDKTVLKNFAVNSRNKLIEDTIYKLNLLGITENEIQNPIEAEGMQTFHIGNTTFSIYDDDIRKRKELIKEVESKVLIILLKKLHILGSTVLSQLDIGSK